MSTENILLGFAILHLFGMGFFAVLAVRLKWDLDLERILHDYTRRHLDEYFKRPTQSKEERHGG